MRRVVAFAASFAFASTLTLLHARGAQTCEFHVSPVWIAVAVAGQSGTIAIDTQPGCAWTASVLTPRSPIWIGTDTTSGSGPGTITYTAAAFPAAWEGSRNRQARIQVRWATPTLGQDVVLTQKAGPCHAQFYLLQGDPTSFSALAGAGGIEVDADLPFSGAWWMETDADWISMSPPSGIFGYGDGGQGFKFSANPNPQPRTATIVGCDGSQFTITQAGWTTATGHYVRGDFDGDGKADLAVYRLGGMPTFYVLQSGSGFAPGGAIGIPMGSFTTGRGVPTVGDFDGDGRADPVVFTADAVYRTIVRYSLDNYSTIRTLSTQSFCPPDYSALPYAADFTGTGKARLVSYDVSCRTWDVTFPAKQWGAAGDVPIAADFDGDGIADLAAWRPSNGTWYILYSTTGYSYATSRALQWGAGGDVPLIGDFDGDGKNDLAVWRPSEGTWYVRYSSTAYTTTGAIQWGASGDLPVPADYDGDGKTDLAVWRPSNGTWYLLYSSKGYSYAFANGFQWGNASLGDRPVAWGIGQ